MCWGVIRLDSDCPPIFIKRRGCSTSYFFCGKFTVIQGYLRVMKGFDSSRFTVYLQPQVPSCTALLALPSHVNPRPTKPFSPGVDGSNGFQASVVRAGVEALGV